MQTKSRSSSVADTRPASSTDLLLLGFIMIAGAVAFLWAGYRGNPTDPSRLIREPWTLFSYFCLVMLALELLVLLTSTPRPSRAKIVATLAVTCLWILVVSTLYLAGPGQIFNFIKQHLPDIAFWLNANKQVTFNVINLIFIVSLWLGIRFASYDPQVEARAAQKVYPGERFVGDLLISTLFSLILSVAFFWPLWQAASTLSAPSSHLQSTTTTPLTVCDLTFLPYASPCKLSAIDVSTIFILDVLILPLIYLGVALSILLYAAYGEALQRFREQQQAGVQPEFPAFPAVFWQVVYDIVNRRLRQLPTLLISLRYFWWILLLAAVVLAGLASKAISWYLYDVASASKGNVLWLPPWNLLGGNLELEFGAATAVLVAMSMTVVAATVQGLEKPVRVAKPRSGRGSFDTGMSASWSASWPHVRFLVVTMASSYWALSIVFSIINELALIAVREYGIVTRTPIQQLSPALWSPFVQPDPLMLISLAVFVVTSPRILSGLFSRSGDGSKSPGGDERVSPVMVPARDESPATHRPTGS